jgi:hypothetical protein
MKIDREGINYFFLNHGSQICQQPVKLKKKKQSVHWKNPKPLLSSDTKDNFFIESNTSVCQTLFSLLLIQILRIKNKE